MPALSFALLLQVPRDSRDEDIDVLLLAVEPTHEADQAWAAPVEQKAVRDQPVDGRFGKLAPRAMSRGTILSATSSLGLPRPRAVDTYRPWPDLVSAIHDFDRTSGKLL